TAIFPAAMRWLWKDWPAPVKAGRGSAQLKEIVIPGEDWKVTLEGCKGVAAAVVNAKGEVFCTDILDGKVYKIGLDGKSTVVNADSKQSVALAFGPDGRLYYAMPSEQILAVSVAGQPTLVADGIFSFDLVVGHNGSVYAT